LLAGAAGGVGHFLADGLRTAENRFGQLSGRRAVLGQLVFRGVRGLFACLTCAIDAMAQRVQAGSDGFTYRLCGLCHRFSSFWFRSGLDLYRAPIRRISPVMARWPRDE